MTTTNLGKVAVVPKGEYSSAVQYERLDIVQYERSSYLVKQAVIGVTPTDGANYALLAGKGDSSYDVAVNNGFIGTEAEWKLYLKSDGSIQALQQFMTNPAATNVTVPDYGNIPSLQGYISTMFENGGLPATPFATKALMTASSLVDGKYAQVTDGGIDNGLYVKTAGNWVKSSYDPKAQAIEYTNTSVDLLKNGGERQIIKPSDLTLLKYYNVDTAAWVAVANPVTALSSDLIPINPVYKALRAKLISATYAAIVLFYDSTKTLISTVRGSSSTTDRIINIPDGAIYYQITNFASVNADPYVYGVAEAVVKNNEVVKDTDLEVLTSDNLAKPSQIVIDKYVANNGSIATGVGWRYIRIPVKPNTNYTFGNFTIDSNGYWATYDDSENRLVPNSVASFTNADMPLTITTSSTTTHLHIDIARPTNVPADYANLMVNEGDTLLPYVEPVDKLTAIKGYELASTGSGIIDGSNATFADVIADSVTTGALIANLPTSDVGLEVGQAYIDTTTATIKVVM